MFDTALIKSKITCVDVAKRCGLPIQRSGDRCVSPLRPGAKNPTSFCVDDDFWIDFGDGRGGDCIDLLAEMKHNGNRGAAIQELARLTGVPDDNEGNSEGWLEYTNQMNARTAFYHTQLTVDDRDYLHSRGLTDEDIDRLMIGRVSDGPLKGRLFLPYFHASGYCAYYATRAMPGGAYPESKYRKQQKDEHCQHIPWGMQTLNRPGDTLVIAEGYFDAASFECAGYPVLSAITGHFSSSQLPMVLSAARKFDRVLIVYDNDPTSHAGEKFTTKMAEILAKNRIPFIVGVVPAPFHDISEYYAAMKAAQPNGDPLLRIVDDAGEGLTYVAQSFKDFDDLEKFIFSVARFTKRSRLDDLFSSLKQQGRHNENSLKGLYKACTSAPPENVLADEILKNYNIIFVDKIGFYEYANGAWRKRSDNEIKFYIDRAYGEHSTAQRLTAVCNLLKTRAQRDVQFDRKPLWNFTNGTLELETGTFRAHSQNDFCSVQASYPYDPSATYTAWEQFITDITGDDPKSAELLQFIPAYAIGYPDCPFEKIFVLTGAGGNGKSVYLRILGQLIGEENCSHVTPRGLLDKFQRIMLKDSIINIAGEIKSDIRDSEEMMKSISSGETISACFKSQDFVNFVSRSKLVFACNGQLASGDTSEGLARRLIIVDFKMQFVDNPDPNDPYQRQRDVTVADKLMEEVATGGVFNWVYAGYQMLKAVGYFTETNDQEELIKDFKLASNPILIFWDEKFSDAADRPATISNKELYSMYCQWCADNGERQATARWFHREFKNVSQRVYEAVRTASERGYRLCDVIN